MSYETDQTDYNPYAKKIYKLIEDKWQRLRSIAYEVSSASRVSDGVEAFRLERVSIIKELKEYIGQEEADMFSRLSAKLLQLHPSYLAQQYMLRDICKNEVESHASFLYELMRRMRVGVIEYNGTDINTKREVILQELYKFKDAESPYKSLDYLGDLTGFELHEMYWILEDLKTKNKLKEANLEFAISPIGAKEVERTMTETYAEKEFRVLKTIHETKHKESNGWVNIWDLEKELPDIPRHELFMILEDLEKRKRLIGSNDQAVWMMPAGIEELEQAERHPERSTEHFPAQVINNYNTFNAPIGGLQQQTNHSTQNVTQNITITNNPDFDKAIKSLAELVQTSTISADDKEELLAELQNINKLALKEPNEALIERAKSKINYFELTANGLALGAKVAPYIPQLINYFETLLK